MSDIRVFSVTEDQADEAAELMLPEQAEALKKGLPITVLAAVADDKAAGVLAGAADNGVFEIESLFVHPDFRKLGMGKALVEKLSEHTDEMGLGLKAEYTLENEDNRTLRPFFEALDFIEDPVFFPSYFLAPLGELHINVRASSDMYKGVTSFLKTSNSLLEAATERSINSGFPLPAGGLLSDNVDPRLSFCSVSRDRISAYVTVEGMSRNLIRVSAVWSELNDPREMMVMLSGAMGEMKKRFPADSRVAMLALNPMSKKLIEHICGDLEQCSFRFIRKD